MSNVCFYLIIIRLIADAPELRLEEVWLPESKTTKDPTKKERGTFEVRLICHIHANPPAQVIQLQE